jgi:dUTP pyrophosphatase
MWLPVKIKRTSKDVPFPEYKTLGAIAFDIATIEDKELLPGELVFLRTGLIVCIPEGYGLIIAARSSTAKKNIVLANGVGIIDQDYCGPEDELHLNVRNVGREPYRVKAGERLAQGLFVPIVRATFEEVEEIRGSNRGGYGTTG